MNGDYGDDAQAVSEMLGKVHLQQHEQRRAAEKAKRKKPQVNCGDCGFEIPKARLEANPVATRCLACARSYEGRMKRGRGY